jgi:hypothetical protein
MIWKIWGSHGDDYKLCSGIWRNVIWQKLIDISDGLTAFFSLYLEHIKAVRSLEMSVNTCHNVLRRALKGSNSNNNETTSFFHK